MVDTPDREDRRGYMREHMRDRRRAPLIAGIEREVAKYRSWLEQKDQEIVELRRDLRVCEAQREDLRVVLAALNQDVSRAGRKLPTEG